MVFINYYRYAGMIKGMGRDAHNYRSTTDSHAELGSAVPKWMGPRPYVTDTDSGVCGGMLCQASISISPPQPLWTNVRQ